MSESKCLVTKLGASVSGDFPKLGELIIPISTVGITPTSDDYMYFVGGGMELRGGITFYNGDTDGADNYVSRKYLASNETGSLVLTTKYSLTNFVINGASAVKFLDEVDIRELTYNQTLSQITLIGSNGNYKAKGDIACLNGKPVILMRLDGNPNITGDIANLAYAIFYATKNNTPLSNFSLRGNSEVSGTIEELVHAIRALQAADGQSQTSGSIQHLVNFSGTNVKFNGNTMAVGSATKLSWTANTITYNGVTIEA